MKLLSEVAKQFIPESKAKFVNVISALGTFEKCNPPLLSSDITCPRCGSSEKGMTCLLDPKSSPDVMWFCSNSDCINHNKQTFSRPYSIPEPKRAMEWKNFCEKFDIGNLFHEISFEKVDQSEDLIKNMRNFAQKPHGIALFMGDSGSGKTYACLAILERFTRFSDECAFYTSDNLQDLWLCEMKKDGLIDLKSRLKKLTLIAIDDFAQREPSPGFMSFIFDLINYRIQWTNKGTIITTNSTPALLSKYCGEALMDRISTANLKAIFKTEKSRRKTKQNNL